MNNLILVGKALAFGLILVLFANYGQQGLGPSAFVVFSAFFIGANLRNF